MMKPQYVLLPLLLLLLSCCSPQEEREQKSSIEQAAEERGHEAARQIKAPLEQADMAKQIQEDRDRKMQEMIEKQ